MSANVPANSIPPVPESIAGTWPAWFLPVMSWLVMIARAVNVVLRGKINSVTTITLTASATSTTITDDRIGPSSHIALTPLTADAAALSPYISSRSSGSAVIHHGSFAVSDLTFSVAILG